MDDIFLGNSNDLPLVLSIPILSLDDQTARLIYSIYTVAALDTQSFPLGQLYNTSLHLPIVPAGTPLIFLQGETAMIVVK